MMRLASRLVFILVLVLPAVTIARQTFKPEQKPPMVDFKSDVVPQLVISTEPGDLPIKLRHASALRDQTLEARASALKVTYTKAGLSVELTNGTYSATTSPWQTVPAPFQILQLEFGTNGEMLWSKAK